MFFGAAGLAATGTIGTGDQQLTSSGAPVPSGLQYQSHFASDAHFQELQQQQQQQLQQQQQQPFQASTSSSSSPNPDQAWSPGLGSPVLPTPQPSLEYSRFYGLGAPVLPNREGTSLTSTPSTTPLIGEQKCSQCVGPMGCIVDYQVRDHEWRYTGENRGRYQKVSTFQPVADGEGTHELIVHYQYKVRPVCKATGALAAIALIAVIAMIVFHTGWWDTPTTTAALLLLSGGPKTCRLGALTQRFAELELSEGGDPHEGDSFTIEDGEVLNTPKTVASTSFEVTGDFIKNHSVEVGSLILGDVSVDGSPAPASLPFPYVWQPNTFISLAYNDRYAGESGGNGHFVHIQLPDGLYLVIDRQPHHVVTHIQFLPRSEEKRHRLELQCTPPAGGRGDLGNPPSPGVSQSDHDHGSGSGSGSGSDHGDGGGGGGVHDRGAGGGGGGGGGGSHVGGGADGGRADDGGAGGGGGGGDGGVRGGKETDGAGGGSTDGGHLGRRKTYNSGFQDGSGNGGAGGDRNRGNFANPPVTTHAGDAGNNAAGGFGDMVDGGKSDRSHSYLEELSRTSGPLGSNSFRGSGGGGRGGGGGGGGEGEGEGGSGAGAGGSGGGRGGLGDVGDGGAGGWRVGDSSDGDAGGGLPGGSGGPLGDREASPGAGDFSQSDNSHESSWSGVASLFCFCLARYNSYEFEIMQLQHQLGTGIFACEDQIIFSEASHSIAGFKTNGIGPINSHQRASTPASSGAWLNTEVFLRIWREIRELGRYRNADWTVKVDPDTVFFPHILRDELTFRMNRVWSFAASTQGRFFFNTCQRVRGGFYGALEVMSRPAVEAYLSNLDSCTVQFDTASIGEDLFCQDCLEATGAVGQTGYDLIMDGSCLGEIPACTPGHAAYHPFKSEAAWHKCWSAARLPVLGDGS